MANKSLTIIAAIAIIGLLFLIYLAVTFESPTGTTTVDMDQPVPREPEVEETVPPQEAPDTVLVPEPEPSVDEPVVPETVAEAEPEPEVVELPALNVSDEFVRERLSELEAGNNLLRIVATDEVIRKFVVLVDNVSRGSLPQLEFPLRRVEDPLEVETVDDNLYTLDPASYDRFDFMVDTFMAVDVDQAMSMYETVRPLLEEAYAEIGYPNRSIDEAMLGAIDTVLNAATAEGPFQLVKPSVMFLYADADIEDMNPVEKQLLRLGPENAERLKEKLRQFRSRLESAQ